jgi:hypothetical protein
VNSFPQYANKSFEDSSQLIESNKNIFSDTIPILSPEEKQNKEDVIRMVGTKLK